jgi:hypothetical protein
MRIFAVILAGLSFAPVSALALSCLPHGVSDAYLEAVASEDAYLPVLGTLTFDAALVPEVDWGRQQDVPPQTLIPARFEGHEMPEIGTDIPFETDVVLQVECFGPWCPAPRPGKVLAFLRKTSDSYVLSTNACGGFLFGDPTRQQIRKARKCIWGRACVPSAGR